MGCIAYSPLIPDLVPAGPPRTSTSCFAEPSRAACPSSSLDDVRARPQRAHRPGARADAPARSCSSAPTASSSDGRLDPADVTAHVVNVLMGGLFHAAILFLVAAGLQVVFGVQKIFNLACGSFYALGAYVGVSAVQLFVERGGPPRAVRPPPRRRRSSGRAGRHRRRARAAPLHLRSRRDVPAAPHLRHRPHAGGPHPHDLGHGAHVDLGPLPRLRAGPPPRRHRARLQPRRHRGQRRHRGRHRVAPRPDHLRADHPRGGREPGDGRGPRRRHAPRLRACLHAGQRARHAGRRARHPLHRRHERDGRGAHRGGVRGRGDRRAREHARGPGRARSWSGCCGRSPSRPTRRWRCCSST